MEILIKNIASADLRSSAILAFLLLVTPLHAAGQTNPDRTTLASPAVPAATASTAESTIQLKQEVDSLRAIVVSQSEEISRQKGEINILAQRQEGNNTAAFTAAAVVLAAFIAGFFALKNQNKQAEQERLLKAVEIIMDSQSGYQADIRKDNLEVFLDDPTRKHLKDIKQKFSGPEFTYLLVSLAQAMTEKATSPEEVLHIWKTVLEKKKVYSDIVYRNLAALPRSH